MSNILSFNGIARTKNLATGEKRYRPVFRFDGKARFSRLMFKRAWEAEAYGKRLAARGLRGLRQEPQETQPADPTAQWVEIDPQLYREGMQAGA